MGLDSKPVAGYIIGVGTLSVLAQNPGACHMPFENLRTFLRLHPDASITKVDHGSDSIHFHEKGREWVMIFENTDVVGVWDMSPSCWAEDAQDQQEARSVAAAFGGWKA